ncbi:unnamed protein product [Lactuca saligna]|uniref:Uncharacterized protein n=1 Tax=Lactuca saligna TaxID=75948 RepID=A0AA36A3D1_LACSI|nr:unnamed protein product [Lactuca saligna]
MKPFEEPKDIQDLPGGLIIKDYWSIMYKKKEGTVLKNCMFYLRDKHLYSTSVVNRILARAKANKAKLASDLKCMSDMMQWYMAIRASLLKIMPKVFEAGRQQ